MDDYVSVVGTWHAKNGLPMPLYEFQRRAEVKEGWVSCPFDASHVVPRDRLDAHVRKCLLSRDPLKRITVCPYDPLHIVRCEEYDAHVVSCDKRPANTEVKTVDYGFGPVLKVVSNTAAAVAAPASATGGVSRSAASPAAPQPPAPSAAKRGLSLRDRMQLARQATSGTTEQPRRRRRRQQQQQPQPPPLKRYVRCMATWDEDGRLYEAVVLAVSPDGSQVVVRFEEYDQVTSVPASAVQLSTLPYWRASMRCIVPVGNSGLWQNATVVHVSISPQSQRQTVHVQLDVTDGRVHQLPWESIRPLPSAKPRATTIAVEDELLVPLGASYQQARVSHVNGQLVVVVIAAKPAWVNVDDLLVLPDAAPDFSRNALPLEDQLEDEDDDDEDDEDDDDQQDQVDDIDYEDTAEEEGEEEASQLSTGGTSSTTTSQYDSLRMRSQEEMAWECRLTTGNGSTFLAAATSKKVAKTEAARQAWETLLRHGRATLEDLGIVLEESLLPELSIEGWHVHATASVADCDSWIAQHVLSKPLADGAVVGFDTEWDNMRNDTIALIQLATDKVCLLFSTKNASRTLPANLIKLLTSPSIAKAGVDLDQDVQRIGKQYRISVKNVFDAAIEAVHLGFGRSAGTRRLCSSLLGKQLTLKDKAIATSSWQSWPLQPEQISYAAADAVVARLLAIEIRKRLRSDT